MTRISTAAVTARESARDDTGRFGEQERSVEEVALPPSHPRGSVHGRAQHVRDQVIAELYAADDAAFEQDVAAGAVTDARLHGMVALAHATGAGDQAITRESEAAAHDVLTRAGDDPAARDAQGVRSLIRAGALRGILDAREQVER